jgi:hypothetical protein
LGLDATKGRRQQQGRQEGSAHWAPPEADHVVQAAVGHADATARRRVAPAGALDE